MRQTEMVVVVRARATDGVPMSANAQGSVMVGVRGAGVLGYQGVPWSVVRAFSFLARWWMLTLSWVVVDVDANTFCVLTGLEYNEHTARCQTPHACA